MGDHRHYEATLVESTGDKSSYCMFLGTDDSCFLLPATELCDSDRRNDDTVLATGVGVRFEAVGSRKYSIWIIVFRYSRATQLFEDGSDEGTVRLDEAQSGGKGFDVLGGTRCVGTDILLRDSEILDTIPRRSPIFYPVSVKARGKIYLDRMFHRGFCVDGLEV